VYAGKHHTPGIRERESSMIHFMLHLDAIGPLPGILAGALWHSNALIYLTAFGVVVWILGKETKEQ
jgi:type IV secretory pathway TrbD component